MVRRATISDTKFLAELDYLMGKDEKKFQPRTKPLENCSRA